MNLKKSSQIEKYIRQAQKKNARDLILDSLELTDLPESIGQLSELELLYICNNQLTKLPDSIGQLTKLRTIFAHNNKLTSLPDSIGQLTQLNTLDVSNNELNKLPDSMRQLKSLRRLYLHHNNLHLPNEILGPEWSQSMGTGDKAALPSEILEYYYRTLAGQRPLNEAKLILVGFGNVGKTSLVNRLTNSYFDKNEKKTDGIKITQWSIKLSSDENVRLHIWDFGGQEIMHSTHQFFLTERSVYLLVLNGRQGHEDADAEYWLNLIGSFGSDSPVLIVLNKIREHPFNVNQRGLKQKFPNICNFFETDCEDGTGIENLFLSIRQETNNLKHLRDAFPESWFAIKDELASTKHNYISYEEYRQLCERHLETSTRSQELLATYLHNLGVALNYRDDPRLRDMHVLNPLWVTNGIYKIINAGDLSNQQGELYINHLQTILEPIDYPRARYSFLLELMRKFELCFRFPDNEELYLIPDLLDKQQPEEASIFARQECLNFQYNYPSLPEGLIPRFIVRTHVLSKRGYRWRTGVILEFEGNRALVKADMQDKRIYVYIIGPLAGRRRLLAVIRSDFEHIHRSFKFEPLEMVPIPNYPDVAIPYKHLLVMENKGIREIPQVINDRLVTVNVRTLLNGVDLERSKRDAISIPQHSVPVRLFYCYAHKDESLRDELETHLKLLQRQGIISVWHDRRIAAGEKWVDEIDQNLEQADIILLLVSADFIASDYCYNIELKRAMEKHKSGNAIVIPIIIRNVNWGSAPFSQLQVLPTNGEAVTAWIDRDTAWRVVAEGIEQAVRQVGSKISAQLSV